MNTRRQFISGIIHVSSLAYVSSLSYASIPKENINCISSELPTDINYSKIKPFWRREYKKILGSLITLSVSYLVFYKDELLLALLLLFLFFISMNIGIPLVELVIKYHLS